MDSETAARGPDISRLRSHARVLLLMDRRPLIEEVGLALSHGPYVVYAQPDALGARTAIQTWQPHLVIVDIDVQIEAAVDLLMSMTTGANSIPVIALTRRGDLRTKLWVFERGMDDILTVPFSPEELCARVKAIIRRMHQDATPFTPVIRLGELEIDIARRRVRIGSIDVQFTSIELSLLYLLAANAGRAVTREEILNHLWGPDYVAESNVVDRHIGNVRRKLHAYWHRPRSIVSVPSVGYRLLVAAPADAHGPATLPPAGSGREAAIHRTDRAASR